LLAVLVTPGYAQVSGPYSDDSPTQESYGGGGNYITPEEQNINQNNLDTSGTGMGYVGVVPRYVSQVGNFSTTQLTSAIRLGWTLPSSAPANMVNMVEFQILPGRQQGPAGQERDGTPYYLYHPARIVENCPSGDNSNFYRILNANNDMRDLSQPITLQKCSNWWNPSQWWGASSNTDYNKRARHTMVIRLTGKIVETSGGGYVAAFGPHDSTWNCVPPTWPSAEHQAAGQSPYAEWCDVSVWWWVQR